MNNTSIQYPGRFQLWLYGVGHGRLLLRRAKSDDEGTQVDILFLNVKRINLPTVFDDIKIELISDVSELKHLKLGVFEPIDVNFYSVSGKNCRGDIVAGSVFTDESQRFYYEESPLLNR